MATARTSTTTARTTAKAAAPKGITVTTNRAPTNADGKLACAKIPFLRANDAATVGREARAVGMTSVGNSQWVHPKDGSWVMLDDGGRLQRGVRRTQFDGIPQPYVEPADPKQAKALEKLLAETPRIPRSMANYAIAKIGIVSAGTLAATLPNHGFLQIGTTWVHPDGSWVQSRGGNISCLLYTSPSPRD